MTSAVILGMIVTMFPEPRRAGQGDRRLRLRRLRRRLDRPAARRRAHRRDQLALDLLHQRADRHRHRAARAAATSTPARASGSARAPTSRVRCCSPRGADARRLHDPRRHRAGWGSPQTLGLGAVSLAAARRLRRAPGADRQPADAAAAVPLAQRRPAPTSSRRCWSPACSGCSSSAPSTCSASSATTPLEVGLAFLPATLVMGIDVAAALGAADHALRRRRRR